MAMPVLIIGKSGSGKSSSLRNFKDNEVSLVNVLGKTLPFKNKFQNVFATDEYPKVSKAIKLAKTDVVVIDDAGYLITNMFMKEHSNSGSGNSVFALYNRMADNFWTLIEYVKELDDPNKIVYFFMHEDKNDFGDVKPKTIGKLLDEKVCIEGMFTIVLHSVKSSGDYKFMTKTDGMDVTKTPIGMFTEEAIDNDLKLVDTQIREYYEMGGSKNE